MKILKYLLLISSLLALGQAHADFESGLAAVARRDYAAALKAFKPLAEKGNAAAQINLGNLYMKGLGVEQNYSTAFRWYLGAAEQGERMAQTKLGILYYHGLGVKKDSTEAARWFQMAAEQDVTSAQSILGSLYAAGDGVPKDLAMAYYWYTMAEEQGSQEAGRGRKSLEDELAPRERDEALRRLGETKKLRIEQEERDFEKATAGLGTPPEQPADKAPGKTAGHAAKPVEKRDKHKKQGTGQGRGSGGKKPAASH